MSLVITGIGMVTPVGKGRDGYAAIRAGLSRTDELDGFAVTLEDELNPSPILGSSYPEVTGFQGYSRLAYLMALAMKDITTTYSETIASSIRLYVKIPSPTARPALFSQLFDFEKNGDEPIENLKGSKRFSEILSSFLSNPAFNLPNVEVIIFENDDNGITTILDDINRNPGGKGVTTLLAATDSFLDFETVEAFLELERVLIPGGSSGFQISEGAAVLSIESDSNAKQKNHTILGTIEQWVSAKEEYTYPTPFEEEESKPSLLGKKITQNFLHITEKNQELLSSPISGFYDFNGERDRAIEWGNALAGIPLEYRNIADIAWNTPLESTGNCGIANSFIALCCAIEGKQRNYRTPPFLINSSLDSGLRETLLVR